MTAATPVSMTGARASTPFLSRVSRALVARIDRTTIVPLALTLSALAGLGDYLTGVELAFTLLYALPIGLATWFRDKTFGVVIAIVSVAFALGGEIAGYREGTLHGFTLLWNHAGSLGLYLVGVELVARLKAFVETEELEKRIAVEQLRHAERLNVIGKLAAGVAHELGTPINVIMGSAEILLSSPGRPELLERAGRRILEQTTRMTAIIRHLLDFGRKGGAGKIPVDLAALARDTASLLKPIAQKRGAEIVVEAEGTIPITANRIELEQVVSNLVVNGLEAMPERGKITIRARIRHGTTRSDDMAELSVTDQGEGIRPDDLPFVFDPFFTTKELGVGTGLGLSVSFGIVQDHSGQIEVQSRLGEGTTFTVLLPRVDG